MLGWTARRTPAQTRPSRHRGRRLEVDGVRDRVDEFVLGDLEDGIPPAVGSGFDVVIAADVIEHVTHPSRLLRQMAEVANGDGEILISVPNFGHWYPRLRVASGMFDYDRRGILDETHLRFFSRRSLLRAVRASGIEVLDMRYTGLPLEVLSRGQSLPSRIVRRADQFLLKLRPNLFGYQFVLRARPHHAG